MKTLKALFVAILVAAFAGGAYWHYHHTYVETLMLSEIVSESDKPFENILRDVLDFDTGLTWHDLRQIRKRKDYWRQRMDEIVEIADPEKRANELTRFYTEMGEDKSMKKLRDKV